MVSQPPRWGSRYLPEFRIQFQTDTRNIQIAVPSAVQAAALAGMIAGAAAIGYLATGWFTYDRLLADKDAAVLRAETANADLQDALATLRNKLGAIASERTQAQSRLAALTGQTGTLRGLLYTAEARLGALEAAQRQQLVASEEIASWKAARIAELTQALERAEHQLRQIEAQRATLAARLNKTEADRRAEQERYTQYKASVAEAEKKLHQLGAERDKAASERDRLRSQIAKLQKKLAQRKAAGLGKLAEAKPTETEAHPAPKTARAAAGSGRWVEFKRVLASTGLDVEHLLSRFGTARSEGGPFVPAATGPSRKRPPSAQLSLANFAAMRGLIKSLPLSLPLASYRLESGFGERRDPINGHHSFHPGLDLSAPYTSPVYATAPGTVTYAGYHGAYGKIVEIDHGNGISTFYAHLHRYIVSVGQRVRAGAQIGYLGSTGRTTGPHVHYEVRVNGEPQDPEKFIGLARLIPVAAH